MGEFHCMSSRCHLPHCRVLPLGEFTVTIPEPHATLQDAVTWQNQCHDRATLQSVIILSAILKIVFAIFYFYLPYFFLFFNAVWALTSGGFRIVSDTLIYNTMMYKNSNKNDINKQTTIIKFTQICNQGHRQCRPLLDRLDFLEK